MAFFPQTNDGLKQHQKVCTEKLFDEYEKQQQALSSCSISSIKQVLDTLIDEQYKKQCYDRLNKLIQRNTQQTHEFLNLMHLYGNDYVGFQKEITETLFKAMESQPVSQESILNMGKIIQTLENKQYKKECHLRFQKIVTEQLLKSYETFQGPITNEMKIKMEQCLKALTDEKYKNECFARFNKLQKNQELCKFLHPMFTLQPQPQPQQKETPNFWWVEEKPKETVTPTPQKQETDIYKQCILDAIDDELYDDMLDKLMGNANQSQKIEIHFMERIDDADMFEFNVTRPLCQTQQPQYPGPIQQQGLPQQMPRQQEPQPQQMPRQQEPQPQPRKQEGLPQQMPRQQQGLPRGPRPPREQQQPMGKHTTTKPQLIGYKPGCVFVLPANTKYQRVKLLPTYQADVYTPYEISVVSLVEGEYLLLAENTTYHVLEC
jgi:hypothetical protein